MVRALIVTAALVVLSGAGAGCAMAGRPASMQGQRMVEGRIVTVRVNEVQFHDGTMVTIPRDVAQPMEYDQGDTVKLSYEVRNGQNVATSIRFMDRPPGLKPR